MDIVRALVLGVIQAITEFLPISSSAHLILFRDWIGFESTDGLTFDVALHVGTVAAVIIYFRRDLARLVAGAISSLRSRDFSTFEHRMPWFLLAATVPAAIAGATLDDLIENTLRTPSVIVVTLVVGALLFLGVERWARRERRIEDMGFLECLVIGVAQSLALVPGVSRSGITIFTGMSLRLRREQAARFSFLLSVPIMLGAGAKKAMDLPDLAMSPHEGLVVTIGMVTSAVFGWIVIRWLLAFLTRHRLDLFAYYRLALAAVIAVWLWR